METIKASRSADSTRTPPVGYAPKESEAAQVRQPKVEEADPSSVKTGAEGGDDKAKPEVPTMDAGSSGGSSLSDSAPAKQPEPPSASDPTRVSVLLRSPAPKASGKSWTPPAGHAPKKSGATSSSTGAQEPKRETVSYTHLTLPTILRV